MEAPLKAFVINTLPLRADRSTNSDARNPGIEPVCPTYAVPPTSRSRSPSPYPVAGDCTVAISSSVEPATTSS